MKLYVRTVAAMQTMPEPAYVTYRLVTLDGGSIHLGMAVAEHELWIRVPPGNSSGTAWSVAYRTADSTSMVIDRTGQRYVSKRSFFDPTWYGAYRSIHHGILFLAQSSQGASQPTQRAIATPAPTPTPDPALAVIAVTSADSALYNVKDRGTVTCPNGDPGRALEFAAKGDAQTYQLSAAAVDDTNGLFCILRFTDADQRLGLTDTVEQYYDRVGVYWMCIGGQITRRADPPLGPVMGLNAGAVTPMERVRADMSMSTRTYGVAYRFTEIAFPIIEPDDFFVLPMGQ